MVVFMVTFCCSLVGTLQPTQHDLCSAKVCQGIQDSHGSGLGKLMMPSGCQLFDNRCMHGSGMNIKSKAQARRESGLKSAPHSCNDAYAQVRKVFPKEATCQCSSFFGFLLVLWLGYLPQMPKGTTLEGAGSFSCSLDAED